MFFECTFYYPIGFPKPSLTGRDFLWSHVCRWYVHYGHDNSHYINKPWRVWFLTWSCILFLFLCVGSSAPVFELTLGSEDSETYFFTPVSQLYYLLRYPLLFQSFTKLSIITDCNIYNIISYSCGHSSKRKPMSIEEYIYKYMSRICGNLLEDKSRLRKDI